MRMWREEGFRGFMRGNGINCLRIIPYRCVVRGSRAFYVLKKKGSFLQPFRFGFINVYMHGSSVLMVMHVFVVLYSLRLMNNLRRCVLIFWVEPRCG